MLNFFKNFGRGILYILVLPLLLVALAVYAVVALFVFIFLAFKGLFLFFTGRSLYEDLPEDIEAKKRLGILKEEEPDKPQVQLSSMPNPEDITGEEVPEDDISNDPFYVPTYLRGEEEQEEESFKDEPEVNQEENTLYMEQEQPQEEETYQSQIEDEIEFEDKPIEPEPEPLNREEEVISLEKSVQNPTVLDIKDAEDEDDEESDSGINIDFN